MKLSVADRLLLLNILPKEGSLTTIKLMRELREELSFSEEENKKLGFKQEGDMVLWNFEADLEKEIKISDILKDVIKKTLKELDKSEKLTEAHLGLWDMFVENN